MTETNLAVDFKLGGKAALSLTQKSEVGGVMQLSMTMPYGAGIDLDLGGNAPICLLLVKASEYGPGLTYQINGGGQGYPLEAPLVLNAQSAVDMLANGQPVTSVKFVNKLQKDAKNLDVALDVLAAGKKTDAAPAAPAAGGAPAAPAAGGAPAAPAAGGAPAAPAPAKAPDEATPSSGDGGA